MTTTTGTSTSPHGELTLILAEACRILARAGLAEDILGHVSARTPNGDTLLVRSRSPKEHGLLFTTPEDIHEVASKDDTLPGGYRAPNEFPIHSQVMKARPDAAAVVHAHPRGVPVHPRGVLIHNRRLAREMVRALDERSTVLLRGHGLTSTGEGLAELPDLSRSFNHDTAWRHKPARLRPAD